MKNAFLLLAFGLLTHSVSAQTNPVQDEQALREVIQEMQDGWNAKSGAAFAAHFADDHDYIVWDGQYFPGMNPEVNARAHQSLYDGPYKETDLRMVVDKIRFIRPDVALVHVLTKPLRNGKAQGNFPELIITILCTKAQEDWKIVSFHNLNIEYDTVFRRRGMTDPSNTDKEAYARKSYPNWYADRREAMK